MRLVPEDIRGQIQFYQTHLSFWAVDPSAIGVSEAEVTALSDLTAAAREAHKAQGEAQQKAQAATLGLRLALEALATAGSAIIQKIRARAATDGRGVYSLAAIPAPAEPSRVPPPGKPVCFEARLTAGGSLKLSWKCRNPKGSQGTIYQVCRRIGFEGPMVCLGSVGRKSFLDTSVPAGAPSITYQVIAMRSTASGDPALFTVNFGTSAGAVPANTFTPRRAA